MPKLQVLLLLLLCPLLHAQQTLDTEPFNNNSVVKLTRAGFAEDVIVGSVFRSQGNYDTSLDALTALREAGVGDSVIAAVVPRSSQPFRPPALQAPTVAKISVPPAAEPTIRPKVLLKSKSHSNVWTGSRDQSMEMSKDFWESCPEVQITINSNLADYTVNLNHIEHGLIRDNQLQVVNRSGDLVSTVGGPGSIRG